jgi:hypothetical protein
MSKLVPIAKRSLAAAVAAIVLGTLFFILGLWAFQPFAGPVEMVSRASRPEIFLALVLGVMVAGVSVRRVLRSGGARAELRRAIDAIAGENEA